MSRQFSRDFLIEVSKGNISGHSLVHKFGAGYGIGTTFTPITISGVYRTPQVGSATTLRVKAGNVNDTAAGTGAREITLIGLDATGAEITQVLATAGTSASSATSLSFIRLYRAYVSKSGTYATSTTGSHAADITIENGAGGTDWATIRSTNFPRSQTTIAAYSVPLEKTAYLLDFRISSDASKSFSYLFFKRESILDTAAPYQAMRLQFSGVGINAPLSISFPDPIKFTELTDIGFLARATSGSADMTAEFNLLLVDN